MSTVNFAMEEATGLNTENLMYRTLMWKLDLLEAMEKVELLNAINSCDVAKLEKLINCGQQQFGINYYSPLMAAVQMNGHSFVEYLLRDLTDAANVDLQFDGSTPLMVACNNGDLDMCRLLLKYGADVNAASNNTEKHNTALHIAACKGHYEISIWLLDHGAKLHDPGKHLDISPILAAINSKCSPLLDLFLDHFTKRSLQLPLDMLFNSASQHSSEECAISVLQQGYYPMHQPDASMSNSSYFQRAANFGFVSLMSRLLELNLQLMQEDWLVQENIPARLAQHSDFVSWLAKCRKQAAPLQKQCKSVILAQLKCYYIQKINELPLPNVLKKFLKDMKPVYNTGDWVTDLTIIIRE